MSATDWEALYQAGDMRWEKGAASPGLVDFIAAHPELPRGTVLVPGCGTGNDVGEWARAGFAVTGMDLAPSAIRLAEEKLRAASLRAELVLGDFLAQAPAVPFDVVFEHTLFCAIQPSQRDDYIQALLRWLKPHGTFLAIHYMLRGNELEPPFGVSQEELMERFLPHFELVEGYVPRSYANRTGLELLLHWRRKA